MSSNDAPEQQRAEFLNQAVRLRKIAADATSSTARQHFEDLAATYDRLSATAPATEVIDGRVMLAPASDAPAPGAV